MVDRGWGWKIDIGMVEYKQTLFFFLTPKVKVVEWSMCEVTRNETPSLSSIIKSRARYQRKNKDEASKHLIVTEVFLLPYLPTYQNIFTSKPQLEQASEIKTF